MDSDFHDYYIDDKLVENTKEISIGDNVWIGNNVIILKGVNIGDCKNRSKPDTNVGVRPDAKTEFNRTVKRS